MAPFIPLIGGTIALLGSITFVALGAAIIMKRTETTSLFVEDQMGFVVAKLALASILIAIGLYFGCSAIRKLVEFT